MITIKKILMRNKLRLEIIIINKRKITRFNVKKEKKMILHCVS